MAFIFVLYVIPAGKEFRVQVYEDSLWFWIGIGIVIILLSIIYSFWNDGIPHSA